MKKVNLNPKSPIEAFTSNFHYAWNADAGAQVGVEHYVVSWTIENLRFLVLEEHKSVSSPEFALDSSRTAWSFEVYPNGLCNAAQSIDLLVKRSDRSGPPGVGLTFRFGVLRTDGETAWLEERKVESFQKGTFREVSVQDPLRRRLSEDKFRFGDAFTIACEMYVTYATPRCDAGSLDAADHDLANFAFDLSGLLRAVEVADLTLGVPGLRVRAHRAILAARSATAREILAGNGSRDEIRFEGVSSPDSFVTVVRFAYSANLTSALRGKLPGVGLYECARKLGVADLAALLAPCRIRLRSVLKSQELTFTWTVRDFTRRSKSFIKSQAFSGPSPGAAKWHLITHWDRATDTLGVCVETSGETGAVHSILKVSLLDGSGELSNTRLTTRFSRRFGFPDFLPGFSDRNLEYDLLVDDALRVCCELVLVVSSDVHESHERSANHPSSPVDAYRDLSADVNRLLETGAFSDVTVTDRDGSVLAVHRAVLFARSRKFYSKFLYYNRGERNLDVLDVEPDLLRLMIGHAYSGTLEPNMPADAMLRLHIAAEGYVFRQLASVTLHRVASRIDAGNVLRLLGEGRKLRGRYLEDKCLLFVRENRVKVMEFSDWEQCRKENGNVYDAVVKELNQVTWNCRSFKVSSGT